MKRQELKELLTFPLYVAIGALIFSASVSIVQHDIEIMQMAICFAFSMSLVELLLVYLFKDDIEKLKLKRS